MSETKITVTPGAPYKIEGDFTIKNNGVEDVINGTSYLCSCGLSEKKPYCDGSHTKPRTITVNLDELNKLHSSDTIRNVEIKY